MLRVRRTLATRLQLSKNEKRWRHGINIHTHHICVPDGTRIRYFDTEEELPALVLANGLGGPISAWYPYIERWRGRFRILSWDYRGLYGSILPHKGSDMSVDAHVRDLKSILDQASISRAVIIGWSMGVQVALEFYSQHPSLVSRLTLISGSYGRPLGGVPLPLSESMLPPLMRAIKKAHPLGSLALRAASRSRLSFPLLKTLGLVSKQLDRERFQGMLGDIKDIDLKNYFELLKNLAEHNAESSLRQIGIPTLVVAGSRDFITPPWLARKIAAEIPMAELLVIAEGTHYAAAEFPSLISKRIELFLRDHPII